MNLKTVVRSHLTIMLLWWYSRLSWLFIEAVPPIGPCVVYKSCTLCCIYKLCPVLFQCALVCVTSAIMGSVWRAAWSVTEGLTVMTTVMSCTAVSHICYCHENLVQDSIIFWSLRVITGLFWMVAINIIFLFYMFNNHLSPLEMTTSRL